MHLRLAPPRGVPVTFVGVCGGRDFADTDLLVATLDRLIVKGDVIVHGDAKGADAKADFWARSRGRDVVRVPARWDSFGKGAGMRRNAVIAALPLRLLIAFPGGVGTAGMVRLARAKGIPVEQAEETSAPVAREKETTDAD